MAYATEAELEAICLIAFDANSTPNSTEVGTFLTEISSKLDGLMNQTAAAYGSTTTCPEWVKQATLAGCKYAVDCFLKPDMEYNELHLIAILRSYAKNKDTNAPQQIYHYQDRPNASGNW